MSVDWADPAQRMPQQINTEANGRGLYFESPDGHSFEVFTQPPSDRAAYERKPEQTDTAWDDVEQWGSP
jgi:hypothetical protein